MEKNKQIFSPLHAITLGMTANFAMSFVKKIQITPPKLISVSLIHTVRNHIRWFSNRHVRLSLGEADCFVIPLRFYHN